MRSLTPEQIESLRGYGFDPELFARWQKQVRKGLLSLAANALQAQILAPDPGAIDDLPRKGSADARELDELGSQAIRNGELGVVILNGGMATRFGGIVKGIVEVLSGRSFLGLKLEDVRRAQQSHGGTIPVFVMNSFATDEPTKQHLLEHDWIGLDPERIELFRQFISVRMEPGGDVLLTKSGELSPYGPGHGDCVPALRHHGCLGRFLAAGGKYLFVTNVDNLGARVSAQILGHHVRSRAEATIEVAPKWPGDVGGAPYLVDGRLQLVEQLRYPAGFDPDIVNVFNTNTFHFSAAALDREFELGWYYVEKKVDGRKAVQIERLIGEMTRFLSSSFVRVKRTGRDSRFFPIKTPEDLAAGREEITEMYPGSGART